MVQAEIARQALDMFASIYGAEAGNLALKGLTLDGVYVAGGIAPKLLKKLQDGSFMRGFTNKGRYKRLMNPDSRESRDLTTKPLCSVRHLWPRNWHHPFHHDVRRPISILEAAGGAESRPTLSSDGMVVGLGTGTTAKHLIMALGERVREGTEDPRRTDLPRYRRPCEAIRHSL